MRKLQITAIGEPTDVLELVEFEAPAPGPGQVLVEVEAATINASDFLYILFGCESFHPGSDSSINMAGFCNKSIDAKMKAALKLGVTNEDAANAQWTKIDRLVTDSGWPSTLPSAGRNVSLPNVAELTLDGVSVVSASI